MTSTPPHPSAFLDIRVHEEDSLRGLTAFCAGYECDEWRAEQLAYHLIEWLPEFALTHKELETLGSHNVVRLLSKAAEVIYNTRTTSAEHADKRGEIGEILLHIAIRQVFKSIPAISKFYYKDSANNTVKGFDAVHVVATSDELQLWLGEVKFYKGISSAIRDVVKEIDEHTERDYLRSEFSLIANKIDDSWPVADRLKRLLDRNTSLDEVFSSMAIPVFLTYESRVIRDSNAVTEEFRKKFDKEVRKHYKAFSDKNLPPEIKIHLFLLPLKLKSMLVEAFEKRLKSCQSISGL